MKQSKHAKNTKKDFHKFKVKTHVRKKAIAGRTADAGKRAEGIFLGSRSGFGFVKCEGMDEDVFIPAHASLDALDGDTVEITYRAKGRYGGRADGTEGKVVRIVEYAPAERIGTLAPAYYPGHKKPQGLCFVADDRRLSITPAVTDAGDAKAGDKVRVYIKREPGRVPTASLLQNFGPANTRGANYAAILAECAIETDFSDEELEEADRLSAEPIDSTNRKDLTAERIMTIDGAGAKDLDDAVSLHAHRDGTWDLYVHIADVSSYVREKSALDRAVMRRGTSVYFTDKVVPMLPPALSNGACSLNAGEKKAALTAKMHIGTDGAILSTEVFASLIESRVRGVYSEVNDLFQKGKNSEYYEKYKEMFTDLGKMHKLYEILLKKSRRRGALDFELPDAIITLNGAGDPIDVAPALRGDAERMIEQFMLAANEGVATLLSEAEIPCVYRVHARPPEDKKKTFIEYAHNLGFDTSDISREKCTPADFSALLKKAEERGLGTAVCGAMLRTMAKAEYSETEIGHFGLSLEKYCHFTSPIRRLSDLATHRIIHKVLLEVGVGARYAGYAKRAAAAATEGELRALNAERRIEDLYKCIYMEKHIGEEYDATVTSVTSFGVFATLENTCEGLIPLGDMPGVFLYDEKTQTLRSREITYRPGDRIVIRVKDADVCRGKVSFADARFDAYGIRA